MPLSLQADLGIEQVTDLQATLQSHLDDATLELSGAEVRRVHTAGLQLLHAFIRGAPRADFRPPSHSPRPRSWKRHASLRWR
ncbi:STAS domain-containing protein [Thermomonas sp. S9]|uniref:STAS domain-containing protein n=1 Tax=Thermomonas sp. S9 TaxID=2885203 RepID=UPI00216B3721|nr:STAS domain-containing protein [Thermomonas sp. S9]MCR6496405.1 STAS domain-containing protein [Thermomonas sp. S9]